MAVKINRTIRLFVSSTFSDLGAERDVLQRDVFPRFRELCTAHGFRFQAIDLRWGISEETGRDNRTMRICLRELHRCQEHHPKPHFLILLGDRYGWRPLPETMPAALFTAVREHLAGDPAATRLLTEWYRVDENAVPPVAELQPRGDGDDWHERVETPLLGALESATQALGVDVGAGLSATEQEIIDGALRVADAPAHVRAFFRAIDGLPDDAPPEYAERDPRAIARLESLKSRIEHHIGEASICRYRVPWRSDAIDPAGLTELAEQVRIRLGEVIEREIAELAKLPPDEAEDQAHEQFGAERSAHFVGRVEPLERIDAYLRDGASAPLAVIGAPGCGKSAFMARAVAGAHAAHPRAHVIARYIGTTPASVDLIPLLRGLVGEIRRAYPLPFQEREETHPEEAEIPFDFDPLLSAFYRVLQRPHHQAAPPLFLFIDALDQLTDANGQVWLPSKLPEAVRLVVSSTADVDAEQRLVLAGLTAEDGEEMLANWLADAGRTLQTAQRRAILETFSAEGSALWLRTAAAEAALLPSWQPPPDFAPTTPALLGQVLDRLAAEDEHGPELVWRTLGYLASARHGLAEDEVLELVSSDEMAMSAFRRRSPRSPKADALPAAVWVRLHGDLFPYLAERQAQGATLLGFYHRSFFDAVVARLPEVDWHPRLAHYFRGEADPRAGSQWSSVSPRPLAELPFHLLRAGRTEDLYALYSDVMYLDARFRAQQRIATAQVELPSVLELLRELHDAQRLFTDAEPLNALVRLLNDRNVMLARFPENAAQEIANYFGRYSQSDAARAMASRAREVPARLALQRTSAEERPAGHSSTITALAVSPSGAEFVSGADDGTVGYWPVNGTQPYWVTAAHEEKVTSIALSPDGRTAITAGADGLILVWNLALATRRHFRPLAQHASEAWVGGFLNDTTAAVTTAGLPFALDVLRGTMVWRAREANFQSLAVSPDARFVYAAEKPEPQTLWRFSAADGAGDIITKLERPWRQVGCSPRGDAIVVSDHHGYVVAYLPDGTRLDGGVFRPPLGAWCFVDERTIAGVQLDGRLARLTLFPRLRADQLEPEGWSQRPAIAIAALPGRRVVTGHDDGSLSLIDMNRETIERRWEPSVNLVDGVLLEDGRAVGVAGWRNQGEGVLGRGLHHISRDGRVSPFPSSPHAQLITGIAAIEDGAWVTVDRGGTAAVWKDDRIIRIHHADIELTSCCTWTEGGVAIAGTSGDAVCMLGMGKAFRTIELQQRYDPPGVSAVAAAGRPPQIIAALNNSEVASAGLRTWRKKSESGMGTAAAIDPACRFVATGHGFGKIHLWNAATGSGLWQQLLHAGPVRALAFGRDGLLFSAGADRRLLAVDPEDGRVVAATMLPAAPVALRTASDPYLEVLDTAAHLYVFE